MDIYGGMHVMSTINLYLTNIFGDFIEYSVDELYENNIKLIPCGKSKTHKIFNPLKGISPYGWHFEQEVYLPEGLARAIKAGGGSGNIPKVILPTYCIDDIYANREPRFYEEQAPCLRSERFGLKVAYIDKNTNKCIKEIVPQTVKIRVNEVDVEGLKDLLRESKKKLHLTNKDIAEQLDIPLTKVEHWFRTDNCFAIPDDDIWFDLKKILCIDNDNFDKSIMEFEYRDGVYEKSDRCYYDYGVCPTLTCNDDTKIIITGTPYIDKNYQKFYEEHGYIPEMFNAYNCSEITDIAPTLTCNCGSATTSSSVLKIEKINNKTEN